MEPEIKRRGLWNIYRERMRLPPIALAMERRGITLNSKWAGEVRAEYAGGSERAATTMQDIAGSFGYPLELPKGAANASLKRILFDVLRLEPLKLSEKTGKPSTDKDTLDHWSLTLPPDSTGKEFVDLLVGKRQMDTAVAYVDGYERFMRHVDGSWGTIHPSLNPTGTDTLRWSSSNPNEQNISKKEKFNLRRCFGPAPGREWWSLDYQNLELRIPAFEADERELIEVFNRPNDPPYYGSYHLVVFDVLHPLMFAEFGKKCKDMYESTWYQWVKNGNFAVLYGCQERKANLTYRVTGAYRKIRHRFPRMAELADRMLAMADKEGQVWTLPDKSVDPDIGYPIMTERTEYGRVSPTIPLNYHVQSTAMWCTARAMVRCEEQLRKWREQEFDGHLALQVHDEIVFDFPKGADPLLDVDLSRPSGRKLFRKSNLGKVDVLAKLMGLSGEGIGVPTPVAIEFHDKNWAEGRRI